MLHTTKDGYLFNHSMWRRLTALGYMCGSYLLSENTPKLPGDCRSGSWTDRRTSSIYRSIITALMSFPHPPTHFQPSVSYRCSAKPLYSNFLIIHYILKWVSWLSSGCTLARSYWSPSVVYPALHFNEVDFTFPFVRHYIKFVRIHSVLCDIFC